MLSSFQTHIVHAETTPHELRKPRNNSGIVTFKRHQVFAMQLGEIPKSFADIDKSVEMLGYKPTTNVDIGTRKFIEWYKDYYSKNLLMD